MSAVPRADQRFSFETDGFLVVESFLSPDHVSWLREALRRAISRRRELERCGTPHLARPGEDHAAVPGSSTCWRTIRAPPRRAEPDTMPSFR